MGIRDIGRLSAPPRSLPSVCAPVLVTVPPGEPALRRPALVAASLALRGGSSAQCRPSGILPASPFNDRALGAAVALTGGGEMPQGIGHVVEVTGALLKLGHVLQSNGALLR
jgi:hypothetical protein